MQIDTEAVAQHPASEPTVNQSGSLARWTQIGRHALRLERLSTLRPLREVVAELEVLIIYEHWLASCQNKTKTAEALGISRSRVRKAVKARLEALSSSGAV